MPDLNIKMDMLNDILPTTKTKDTMTNKENNTETSVQAPGLTEIILRTCERLDGLEISIVSQNQKIVNEKSVPHNNLPFLDVYPGILNTFR